MDFKKDLKWLAPEEGVFPEGTLLVAVETNKGTYYAVVRIDDDGRTLIDPEYGDVWTAWEWECVERYIVLED